tara:strand:+ start:356 stop:595 length:240 start_codon:yes stop_codon:yes gene_type:complete
MIIDWSIKTIKEEIDKIKYADGDKMMDCFTTWGCKKDLYEIFWYVEKRLDECGSFEGEEEFIREHNTDKMWSILKGEKK